MLFLAAGKLSNIVHVCSSESYPLWNKSIHCTVGAYLGLDPVANPSKTLVRNGSYAVDWVQHRSTFQLRCFGRKLKLGALTALLRLQGNHRSAKKARLRTSILLCSSGRKGRYRWDSQPGSKP